MSSSVWVALDRDGTLIEDRHYLSDPEGVVLLPGAVEGLKKLQAAGIPLVVITNQSGIGRGYFQEEAMHAVHARLDQVLAEQGVRMQGYYWCPHRPEEGCDCRKPSPGLLLKAAIDLGLEPSHCHMVGDKASDRDLGVAVGGAGYLLGEQVTDLIQFADRVLAATAQK